jgi:hypothetical protein
VPPARTRTHTPTQDYACQAPTDDPDKLAELLSPKSKPKPKVVEDLMFKF